MRITLPLVALLLSACDGSPNEPLVQADAGEWEIRTGLIEPNSELALAEANGKLYLLGGYPASRQTSRTVQVYDIASDSWTLGPQLPMPNNHGMAASVNGKIYLIGGFHGAYLSRVDAFDPATKTWTSKAPYPGQIQVLTAVVLNGRSYKGCAIRKGERI